jgi:methionyl-tRNA formyltransferase
MKTIVIANNNPLHRTVEKAYEESNNVVVIHDKQDLTADKLIQINPEYIFFLHWSHIIPKEIYEVYSCIVFHMTDLPYGRGGSPLQNLITRGHSDTMLSAIKVQAGIDAGPVYLKKKLSLAGPAEEIFLRAGKLMMGMIDEIIANEFKPVSQEGEVVAFKRRSPEQSNVELISSLETLYDYVRMLDAPGYPKAFIETEFFRFEFSRAALKADGLVADVKISLKNNDNT